MSIQLRVNCESLEDPNHLWGGIWVDQDEDSFPERNWHDFVGSVLRDALGATIAVLEGTETAEVYFMDGPFELKLVLQPPDGLSITSADRAMDAGSPPVIAGTTSVGQWARSVTTCTDHLLTSLEGRGWYPTAESDALRANLARLNSLLGI